MNAKSRHGAKATHSAVAAHGSAVIAPVARPLAWGARLQAQTALICARRSPSWLPRTPDPVDGAGVLLAGTEHACDATAGSPGGALRDVPYGVARRRSPRRRSALTIWARAPPSVHRTRTGVQLCYSTVKSYHLKESLTVAISASEARSRLFPLIHQVNDDHLPVRINSKGGDAVLMSAEDFDSWQETIYLLRSPANARRLMEAVERDKSGRGTLVKTLEELQDLAGE